MKNLYTYQDKAKKNSFSLMKNKKQNISMSQKLKFYIKDFFSKCEQIDRKLRIWLHLLKGKPLMKNLISCVV